VRVAAWYNLGGGGAKRALFQHVRGLVAAGHEVEVWCPSTARTDFLPLADLVIEHVDPIAAEALRGPVRVRDVAWQGLRPGAGLAEMDRHLQRCADQISAGGFDVLFANTCQYNAVPDLAHRTALPALLYLQEPRRVAYEAHPVLPWVGLPGFDDKHRSARRTLRELSELRFARTLARAEIVAASRYRRLLVNSVFSRESVARAYGLDARVCYLGVDTDLFTPGQPGPDRGHLLVVGQVVRHKRLDLVVEAMGSLEGERPRLLCVGDRSDEAYVAELVDLARRRGVHLDIRVSVDDEELVRLMRGSRAVVHAARLEPFGYTPIEAGATGVPAVVVAEGGMKETVVDGDTGWVAEPTVQGLAAALAACLADPEEAARRGAHGRAVATATWSLQEAVRRLELHLLEVGGITDGGPPR
jgi:glycosyltransferase involved in cell wall biosynthesis